MAISGKRWRDHDVFIYGTIRSEDVQRELFGRTVHGQPDSVSGYKLLNNIVIDGERYPYLSPEKNGIVYGVRIKLSTEELVALDVFEASEYTRKEIVTDGGHTAYAYFLDDTIKLSNGFDI